MFQKIKKRDGRIVGFDSAKITSAIARAGNATSEFGDGDAQKLTFKVLNLSHELSLGPIAMHWEEVIRCYADSMDTVSDLIKRL